MKSALFSLMMALTILLLIACGGEQTATEPAVAQTSPTVSPAAPTLTTAPTLQPTAAPTPVPTLMPTATPSPTPERTEPTSVSTSTPTLTPTPTAATIVEPTATPIPMLVAAGVPSPTPSPTPVPVHLGNTPAPTINEAVRLITDGIVHVVGANGTSTGIIVDEKGYIITSIHILAETHDYSIDVWLPEGRMVGGKVRNGNWNTGLLLVELRNPDALDLKPIHFEPLVRSTGPGEGLVAVSLLTGNELATGTRVKAGHDISDLAGNEWFRLKTKPPMASLGGPVLNELLRQVIGIMVLKEIAGKNDFFVLKLESLQRQIDSLIPKVEATPSAPAPTAIPRESAAISEGWTYVTRDCREGWTNCEYPVQDRGDIIRVTAYDYAEDNDASGILPQLEFYCKDDGSFLAKFYPGGLEFNENDSGIRVGVWIDGVQRDLIPPGAIAYPLSVAWLDGHRVARQFYEAELNGSRIEVGSLSYAGKAIGVFNPEGFRSNYWRLPCAR